MASTVSQVVTKFREGGFYPDCPAEVAKELFADALKWLTWKLRLRTTTRTIALSDGVREYDLDSSVIAIREAYFEVSDEPSTWCVLLGSTRDLISRAEPGWLASNDRGTPQRYYVDQAVDVEYGKRIVGFDRLPDASTVSGYPKVTLYTVEITDLELAEHLPAGIFTDDVLLYEMAYRWSIRQDPERVAYWQALRKEALGDVDAVNKSVVDDAPAKLFLSPFVGRTSRAI